MAMYELTRAFRWGEQRRLSFVTNTPSMPRRGSRFQQLRRLCLRFLSEEGTEPVRGFEKCHIVKASFVVVAGHADPHCVLFLVLLVLVRAAKHASRDDCDEINFPAACHYLQQ